MSEFFRRIRYLLNRRRFDAELVNDMEFHREMAAREGGMPLGNTLVLREEARDAWGWTWIERLAQDLRYAFRLLRKSPAFTLAAVLMLAIGIGVNVAAFGFFNMLVLRPLPIRDPATLMRFHRRAPDSFAYALPYPEMAFFRDYSKTLSAVLAANLSKLSMEGEEKPVNAHFVSGNFFSELGSTAVMGRVLDATRDDAPGADPVVVLSHPFWQRHFGADPLVIGKTIRLNGKPATVIGVAARDFSSLSMNSPDVWAPLPQQPYFAAGSRLLTDFSADSSGVQMFGRLAPGATPKAAEAELNSLAAELRRQHPADIWEKETLPSEPAGFAASLMIGNRRGTGSEGRDELYPIFGLICALGLLILAVACGNLGSLLLARGVAREREISIRTAVGAGRARLIRQLFTESLLLALVGSAAGLGMGYVVLRSLLAFTDSPVWLNPVPDWPVVVFAAGTGFVAAILFGLTPALQLARQRHRTTILRQFLVCAQVAASCVLLIVAGLLVRALNHVMTADPGFAYQQAVAIDPGLANHGYTPDQARAYLDTFQNRLRALPGVESVSITDTAPLGNRRAVAGVNVDGRSIAVHLNHIDPQFFETMKIPLLRGRNLRSGDTRGIIVSQSLVRLVWPRQDPLGRHFTIGPEYTVVGVSGSERLVSLEDSDAVEAYFLNEAADMPSMVVMVRTLAPPESLARSAAVIAKSIDPGIFPEVQILKNSFRNKIQAVEKGAMVVSLLGFIAQLLACLGIVGVVAYAVSQRTKEIGIRMALGAKPGHVMAVVLRQFSIPLAVGLVMGVGGAIALSGVLRRQLYGISNLDPAAYTLAIAAFGISVFVAAIVPARKALRVDPMLALRQD